MIEYVALLFDGSRLSKYLVLQWFIPSRPLKKRIDLPLSDTRKAGSGSETIPILHRDIFLDSSVQLEA